MRKTKRFTPTVIARFIRQGRGEGTYTDYLPWHRVTRGDPSSMGRSHLLHWKGRLRELLSDGELGEQLFATMLPDLDDSLEQFPLTPEDSAHPLARYLERDPEVLLPGTLTLARHLGIKHPTLSERGVKTPWRLSTDLLLVRQPPGQPRSCLALAFKTPDFKESRRTIELLRLEREYWRARKVPWLLMTPELSCPEVVLTLRRIAPWALGDAVPGVTLAQAAQYALEHAWRSQTYVLHGIADQCGSMELAQRALWQSVWNGHLPLDLRRGWRPHLPLRMVSPTEFSAFNPILSGRSAWI
jgi:hypothetical protein